VKGTIITLLSFGMGGAVAAWLFGLAFTRSTSELVCSASVPLTVVASCSLVLVAIQPPLFRRVVVAGSIPSLLLFSFLFVGVLREGRGTEWGHVVIAGSVLVASILGGLVGSLLGHMFRKPGSLAHVPS